MTTLAVRSVVVLFAVLAAACAREGSVRVIGPNELPADVYATPSPTPSRPTPAPAQDVRVYFVRDGRLETATRRATTGESLPEFTVRALLSGPSRSEQDEGLETAIPPDAELLEVTVDGSVASVDLSKEFELSAEEKILLLRLGQVVYTLTEHVGISSVTFLIDGEPVTVIAEDGEAHTDVARADYRGLAPRAEPTASPT